MEVPTKKNVAVVIRHTNFNYDFSIFIPSKRETFSYVTEKYNRFKKSKIIPKLSDFNIPW